MSGPSSSSVASLHTPSSTAGYSDTQVSRIEAWKWVAAALMLYEHVWRFGLGEFPPHVQLVGRTVLPLFVLAFASGLAHASRETIVRAMKHLAIAGAVTIPLCALVRPAVPVNVLITFALGVALYASMSGILKGRNFLALVILIAGFGVEFGPLAVAGIGLAIGAAREHRKAYRYWFGGAALLALVFAQASPLHGAIGLVLASMIAFAPIGVPRIRKMFYAVYVFQWPVIAGLAWALA